MVTKAQHEKTMNFLRTQMAEKELLQNVRDLAKALGYLTYHTHRSDRSEPGFPDLVLLRGSRLIFVELKSTRGRFSADQNKWIGALDKGALKAASPVHHILTQSWEVYCWKPMDWFDGTIERTLGGHHE